ncbi:nuclear valosin-containing protein-like isoform X2 [Fopius arisanus]|uniref:Nuclear valosin-containing protein-like isoform X2 n=1 Tax=Fopius arisanus TaxID=64838 RepID=A0A9R1U0R9_9HYME|nr:PREDICTED: nuclear valosin-containing protein-like isoform X2 [Fopius arisanus]
MHRGASSEDGRIYRGMEERQSHLPRERLLLERVQKYLFDNEDQIYIDVNDMADNLQKRYSDYRTKKRGPFRVVVRRAYDKITESMSRQEDLDDVEVQSDLEPGSMNNEIVKMYSKAMVGDHNGNSSDKELIDISSDDDHEDNPMTLKNSVEVTKIPKTIHSCTISKTQKESRGLNDEGRKVPEVPPLKPLSKKRMRESTEQLPLPKRRKDLQVRPAVARTPKFSDIGGNVKVLETVCRILIHMKHSVIFRELGVTPTRGLLLHGPPGCGKSLLANAIAGELGVPILKIAPPELIGGLSGESESKIRELFDQALALAPCVLFFDEIDTLAPHRANAQKEMERRIVTQLLACLDDLGSKENGDKVLVLGATNRPEVLDPALRRAGRFEREIALGIPDKKTRENILKVHSQTLKLTPEIDLAKIAAVSPGCVGADLVSIIREAAIAAVDRVLKHQEDKEKIEEKIIEVVPEQVVEKDPEQVTDSEKNSMETVVEKEIVENQEPEVIDLKEDTSLPQTTNGEGTGEKEVEKTTEKEMEKETEKEMEMDKDVENVEKPLEEDEKEATKELERLLKILHSDVALTPEQIAGLKIEGSDFDVAVKAVQPSSKREGFATVPDVTWEDIGSLREIREELQMAILAPVKYSKEFETFGLTTPSGVLLCGPPGCGKTLLAKAIANEAEINFISVKGPELLSMYVGESEKAVRQCFVRARDSAPCVIFFDELDALCPVRTTGDNSATSRVVNQVLTEMDGIEGRKNVYLMAATNRPEIIDPAVMRPGRFDKILYVGLPTGEDRVDILKALTKNGTKPKFAEDVDLEAIGKSEVCEGFTGADLGSLVKEASIQAFKESMVNSSGITEVHQRHFDIAFKKIQPSVKDKEKKNYEKLKRQYTLQKSPIEDVPVETPVDTPMEDATMEAMET